MRTRRGLIAGALLALTMGAVQAQSPLPIRIGAAAATDHAPIFAGVERGIFAKHGLDAKVTVFPTGVEMINGLLAGNQDVAVLGSTPFLSGISNGFPLVLIGHLHGDATRDSYADNVSIVASKASGIPEGNVAALKGKKIGLPRGTGAETFLLGHLAQAGLKSTDVQLLNVRPPDLVSGLNNGDVDAVVIWEPVASNAAAKVAGAVRVVAGGCKTCYDPGVVLSTRKAIAAHSEALQRFMAAFAESQQWVRQHFDEAAQINMRWIQGVDLDVMKQAIRRSHYDGRMSKLTPEMYAAKALPMLAADGRVKAGVDVTKAIEPKFMNAVMAKNPEYFSDLKPIPKEQQLK
ncbi:MAG: ABC transporter substrate-binding protein [Proteobacteria bacterium]|nr:ABC transporter substrate-binding protein [Pseudomonadota bacterium]